MEQTPPRRSAQMRHDSAAAYGRQDTGSRRHAAPSASGRERREPSHRARASSRKKPRRVVGWTGGRASSSLVTATRLVCLAVAEEQEATQGDRQLQMMSSTPAAAAGLCQRVEMALRADPGCGRFAMPEDMKARCERNWHGSRSALARQLAGRPSSIGWPRRTCGRDVAVPRREFPRTWMLQCGGEDTYGIRQSTTVSQEAKRAVSPPIDEKANNINRVRSQF
eukprot:scaffold13807_cov95-Isochrysis_galbana.AAC.1